jgi:predicted MFS family arabinose efflux permease
LSSAASRTRRLLPLVLATTATQSSIVVLTPIVVAVSRDLDVSVSAVGQARTVLAAFACVAALRAGALIDRFGVRTLIVWGAGLAFAGALVTAAAPSLAVFYAGHAIVGLGVAGMLSAGFAGVGAWFPERDAAWAMGYVVGSQSVAWIVGNPLIGLLTEAGSWRLAYAVPAATALLALVAGLRAPQPSRRGAAAGGGIGGVARDPSARRWAIAELVAYSAWTAELTYVGAFYIQTYGVSEASVGILLAIGSAAFLISTLMTHRIARRVERRRLIAGAALTMGVLLAVVLNVTPSVAFTLGVFCLMAVCAGLRSTGSSALGLSQLPAHPGSMMAARTVSAQLGYMIGAVAGGIVLAVAGFGTLGWVLLAGMAFSAVLIARVSDPTTPARSRQMRTAT